MSNEENSWSIDVPTIEDEDDAGVGVAISIGADSEEINGAVDGAINRNSVSVRVGRCFDWMMLDGSKFIVWLCTWLTKLLAVTERETASSMVVDWFWALLITKNNPRVKKNIFLFIWSSFFCRNIWHKDDQWPWWLLRVVGDDDEMPKEWNFNAAFFFCFNLKETSVNTLNEFFHDDSWGLWFYSFHNIRDNYQIPNWLHF